MSFSLEQLTKLSLKLVTFGVRIILGKRCVQKILDVLFKIHHVRFTL